MSRAGPPIAFETRALEPEEAEAYVAFRKEMLADSPWAFYASPGNDRSSDPAFMRGSLADPESRVFAVLEAGRIRATAGLAREREPKCRHIAYVWGVYVTPSARGRGFGRLVMKAAIEAVRGWSGVLALRLSVSENSPDARRLYESLGFATWGVEPDAMRLGGRSYAEIHMRLALESGAGRAEA